MKLWGENEGATVAASPKKRRNKTLLQTYLISLLSLCLSVCMLLGTTMAWFTSNVEVPENEIYVGTLEVDLLMDGTSLKVDAQAGNEQRKVFDGKDIIWSPAHVESRTLTVVDQGEIPFTYKLTLSPSVDENGKPLDKGKEANWDADLSDDERQAVLADFRRQFNVYVKEGHHEGDITSQDLADVTVWTLVGNLDEIYTGELSVFTGDSEKMVETKVDDENQRSAVHTIAIRMSPEYVSEPVDQEATVEPTAETEEKPTLNDFQGYTLNFNIKLVANQIGAAEVVRDAEQLALLLEAGRSVRLDGTIELNKNISLNGGVLDGGNRTENDKNALLMSVDEEGNDCGILTTGGTIRNLKIGGANYKTSCAVSSADLSQNLYLDQVRIDGVKYALNIKDENVGSGMNKVVVTNSEIHGGIYGENLSGMDFVNCTITESNSAHASMEICGNASFTDCTFGGFALSLAKAIPENTTISFNNCSILDGNKQAIALTEKSLEAMFTQSIDAEVLKNCTIYIDGVPVTIGDGNQ